MSQMGSYFIPGVFPPGSVVQTLTGNSGGAVGPDAGNNINVVGDTITIDVAGNPGTNTLTISTTGAIATTYTTDAGNAVPALGVLNVLGSHGINTAGAGNTVTIAIDNAITLGDLAPIAPAVDALTITTGDISILNGNFNLPTTSAGGFDGVINVNASRFIHSFGATNTFVGSSSGNFTLTGSSSVGIGADVLPALTSGDFNTAGGFSSQNAVTSGSNNASWGAGSLSSLTTTDNNTAIGVSSLASLVTGANNIAIGHSSGSAYTTNESNNIVIGSAGVIADSAHIRIGTNGTQTSTFIVGIDGVNVGSTAKVVTMGTAGTADQLGTATITAGTGISITPGANTITIDAIASGMAWSVINADQTAVVSNGYFCNKAGTLLLALPAVSVVGDTIEVCNINNATGIQITQAAGQQIFIANTSTTLGAAGTLTSTQIGDSLKLVCSAANTTWRVLSMIGNWTPA